MAAMTSAVTVLPVAITQTSMWPSTSLPSLSEIAPPAGTMLVNVDITPDGKGRPEPYVHESTSDSQVAAFRTAYVAAARRVGDATTATM